MKSRITYIACFSMLLSFNACISDDSTFETIDIPQLEVSGSGEETMPIFNFNLGDDCVITPEITYTGSTDNLQYEWSIGTYKNGAKGALEVVSTERVLNYRFTEGGSYYAHLKITDGQVGKVVDYQININRTFENGYFLISNDANEKGNLVFVKTMTPEEIAAGTPQIYMEHCIERMNEGVSVSKLLNTAFVTQYSENWTAGTFTRLVTLTEDRAIFLDPNTLSILAELNYSDVYSGYKATNYIPDSYAPYLYDAAMKKFVHLNMEYMFPYENAAYAGRGFEDFVNNNYLQYGYNPASSVSYVNYSSDEAVGYEAYASYYGFSDPFISTGDMLAGEDILSVFVGAYNSSAWSNYNYILSASKSDATLCSLYFFPSAFTYSIMMPDAYPYSKSQFAVTEETALPKEGTRFLYSATYNRHYYALDNKIYVALISNAEPLPKKSEFAVSFSAGEVITYMDISVGTEEIYVATYNETTKRGSFYIFDAKDIRTDQQGNITPKVVHKDCADKIVNVLYKESA